ncbi:MAG: CRISPR system precrRNA processing endoribonuclease RAMP protein Cas6 [Deltaproteobacteria bacterium]|jgi:CRISPR/Cas system endoribonuclease Cas6 (RAMP superfamily)|nr:CRISPR system precrRNA processing endoribonuclease RAMP protein Cas6 [Deltaproteobacteria bacterium]
MLQTMKIGQFTLKIRALDDLHLPAYKGSTFRGGFGSSLRRVVCALRRQDCSGCLLRDRCVYVYVFETPPPQESKRLRLYKSVPHPFVIEPPLDETRLLAAGATLELGLVLMGQALEYLPYFIYAFMHLGEQGLGKGRGAFKLESVVSQESDGSKVIFRDETGALTSPGGFPAQSFIQARTAELQGMTRLRMIFLTPGRIKHADHLVEKPEFHHLVRALLRRLSSLSYFHGGEPLNLDFQGIIDAATHIHRVGAETRWYDWERYSSRQKERMSLGGFVGTLEYEGDFTPFLPMLAWGEILHVGKGVSFGLGRYRLEQAGM